MLLGMDTIDIIKSVFIFATGLYTYSFWTQPKKAPSPPKQPKPNVHYQPFEQVHGKCEQYCKDVAEFEKELEENEDICAEVAAQSLEKIPSVLTLSQQCPPSDDQGGRIEWEASNQNSLEMQRRISSMEDSIMCCEIQRTPQCFVPFIPRQKEMVEESPTPQFRFNFRTNLEALLKRGRILPHQQTKQAQESKLEKKKLIKKLKERRLKGSKFRTPPASTTRKPPACTTRTPPARKPPARKPLARKPLAGEQKVEPMDEEHSQPSNKVQTNDTNIETDEVVLYLKSLEGESRKPVGRIIKKTTETIYEIK